MIFTNGKACCDNGSIAGNTGPSIKRFSQAAFNKFRDVIKSSFKIEKGWQYNESQLISEFGEIKSQIEKPKNTPKLILYPYPN